MNIAMNAHKRKHSKSDTLGEIKILFLNGHDEGNIPTGVGIQLADSYANGSRLFYSHNT